MEIFRIYSRLDERRRPYPDSTPYILQQILVGDVSELFAQLRKMRGRGAYAIDEEGNPWRIIFEFGVPFLVPGRPPRGGTALARARKRART